MMDCLQILAKGGALDGLTAVGERTYHSLVQSWGHLSSARLPETQQFLSEMTTLAIWQAAILLAVGLVYLLQGWKVVKVLVIVNAAVVGVTVGAAVGAAHAPQWEIPGALIGGLALAVLAWPLMRFAVCIMGGLAGAFIGAAIWRYVAAVGHLNILTYTWVGALAGLIILGVLAFVIFKFTVIFFTSLQGAIVVVGALLGLLLRYPPLEKGLHPMLLRDQHLLMILVAVPMLIGFTVQAFGAAKHGKTPPKEE